MRLVLSFLPLIVINCFLFGRSNAVDVPLHLVVDAGSSGTRFCFFGTKKDSNGCQTIQLKAPYDDCIKLSDELGLADMGEQAAKQSIQRELQKLPGALRNQIQGAAILGTGGFRKLPKTSQDSSMAVIKKAFEAYQIPVHAKVLTGEEEGQFAWQSVAQIFNSDRHGILETGGATIQLAFGQTGELRSVSAPVGINEAFKTLRSESDFSACYHVQGAAINHVNFERCKGFLKSRLFENSVVEKLASQLTKDAKLESLYGMGASWTSMFAVMRQDELELSRILKEGQRICSTDPDILTKEGIDAKFARRMCFQFAYQGALLETTGFSSIRNGLESWPRGASVSADLFPMCK